MSRHIVVSNSTPIILFHNIGHLALLRDLYGEIYIPTAVYEEVIVKHDFISSNNWIKIMEIRNAQAKRFFQSCLHSGEVEAIILSTELSADLLVLDDLMARKYSRAIGLTITGTLGVLIALKQKRIIQSVGPIMRQLHNVGMHISEKLYAEVLSLAGE